MLNQTDYFEKFMVNMLNRKIPVNDGFDVSNLVISRLQTKNMAKRQKIEDDCKHC